MNSIQITNLTRKYPNHKGIFNINLTVKQSEVFGFLGPNGAGKTTTIRHLLGYLKPQEGFCTINNLNTYTQQDKIQAFLGYVPGEIQFFDDMTGKQYLNFITAYRNIPSPFTKELIEYFELDTSTKINKMSKGTKQKLCLVQAFMHNPSILILDEPTSGLDPLMQQKFIDLIIKEKSKGKTIFLSSHIFEEVEKCCDFVGMIKDGKLLTIEDINTLRTKHQKTYTVTLPSRQEALSFAKDFHGMANGNEVTLTSIQSLEDIFMSYYGERQ